MKHIRYGLQDARKLVVPGRQCVIYRACNQLWLGGQGRNAQYHFDSCCRNQLQSWLFDENGVVLEQNDGL